MRRMAAGVLLGFWMLSLAASSRAEEAKLVASVYSDRYHWSTCKVAKKIRSGDLMIFKTPEEAVEKGLNPCKKCYPPTHSKRSG